MGASQLPLAADAWALVADTTVSILIGVVVGLLLASRFRITKAHTPNTDDNGMDP